MKIEGKGLFVTTHVWVNNVLLCSSS